MRARHFLISGTTVALVLFATAHCSGSKSSTQCTDSDGGLSAVGGAVLGPIDNHCYIGSSGSFPGGPLVPQQTDEFACWPDAGLNPDGGPPAASITCGLLSDGGPGGCTPVCDQPDGGPAGCAPQYAATMYNTSGNDDDCKYQTAWSSTPIMQNSNTTFTFTALHTVDGTPVTGANVFAQVFLPSANHISPSTNPPVTEGPPGVYTIGPVIFDQPGQWTVRFHLNEICQDILPDSPHGHAAFYINVP